MQSAQEILQKQKNLTYVRPYEVNKVNSYVQNQTYEYNEYDDIVDRYKHLRLDDSFRKLHIFHAKRIGIQKYIELAKTAEQDGKKPARYFSWLLKHN